MDSFWLIPIGLVLAVVLMVAGYYYNYNINESHSYDETMLVVGKTLQSYSESEREVCVLEDLAEKRIVSDGDNGCKYNIGDIVRVHVSANGNTVKELLQK